MGSSHVVSLTGLGMLIAGISEVLKVVVSNRGLGLVP